MEVPHSRVNAIRFFERFVHENAGEIKGKHVYDFSAGSGYIASLFEHAGAHIYVYDLFPEQCTYTTTACQRVDLQKALPVPDGVADMILFCETIECLPDQYFTFSELSRALKVGGNLLLTTANPSSLRSRLSQFVAEGEHYAVPMPNELNALSRWPGSDEGYFSKVFISGVLRIRTLAALHGLTIEKIFPSPRSSTSWLLLPILFPLIYWFSKKHLRRQLKHDPGHVATYHEIFRLNTSPDVLLGKHLIIKFTKRQGR